MTQTTKIPKADDVIRDLDIDAVLDKVVKR